MTESVDESHLTGLREAVPGYFPPDRAERADMIREGMVCLDTNVLFALYRFTADARGELLKVLDALGPRLFVPHQVALEFQHGRPDVLRSVERTFRDSLSQLDKQGRSIEDLVRTVKTQNASRHSALDQAADAFRVAIDQLRRALMAMRDSHDVPWHDLLESEDKLLARLEMVLEGSVGPAPSVEQLEELHKTAKSRYEAKVPPGYEDHAKTSNASGDFIVWSQILDQASKRRSPVLLVTNDQKGDWVRRVDSHVLGPHPALVEEMRREAGVPFAILNIETFLSEAGDALSQVISGDTITQAQQSVIDAVNRQEFADFLVREHPELMNVELGAGRTWRQTDIRRVTGASTDELSPFRGQGGLVPKAVLARFFERRLLQDELVALVARLGELDEALAETDLQSTDDQQLALLEERDDVAERIMEANAELAAVQRYIAQMARAQE